MSVLFGVLLWPLERFNTAVLAIGQGLSLMIALAIMVCTYSGAGLSSATSSATLPNWTEEGARFGMLWMTGLMAPLAYRMGGFVSIDMLGARPAQDVISAVLTLILADHHRPLGARHRVLGAWLEQPRRHPVR